MNDFYRRLVDAQNRPILDPPQSITSDIPVPSREAWNNALRENMKPRWNKPEYDEMQLVPYTEL